MIKVYYANTSLVEDADVFEQWFEKMHPIRKEKIRRCKPMQDKARSLLAGILLRFALEQEGLSYDEIKVDVREHGKPVIVSAENIYFSISHTGTYALCCISDQEVGADIEMLGKRIFAEEKKLCKMAQKVLTNSEYKVFSEQNFENKKRLFLKYWTRKESYSKAVGKGLTLDFSKIDTERNEKDFWSDWLAEDCYVSVYEKNAQGSDIAFQCLTSLEF